MKTITFAIAAGALVTLNQTQGQRFVIWESPPATRGGASLTGMVYGQPLRAGAPVAKQFEERVDADAATVEVARRPDLVPL